MSPPEADFKENGDGLNAERRSRIFLTGFMGAGKSTIGKLLAEELQLRFYDTDRLVMKGFGAKSVTDIFRTNGEAAFRAAENQVIEALCQRNRFVASVGGGTLVRPETLTPVLSHGLVIYLEAPIEVLFERVIFSGKDRPLLSEPDTEQRFMERFNQRKPFYEQSHITVATHDKTRDEIIARISRQIRSTCE